MTAVPAPRFAPSALVRLLLAVAAAVLTYFVIPRHRHWELNALGAWCAGATVFLVLGFATVLRATPGQTRALATREDDGRAVAGLLVLVGSVASLAGVIFSLGLVNGLQKAGRTETATLLTILGIGAVVCSWLMIQLLYTFRYARLYFAAPEGGIQFEESEGQDQTPDYLDFFYLAVTIGMTFQVSDTNLKRRTIRRVLTGHALISYAFNTVLIALTINTVAGLLN